MDCTASDIVITGVSTFVIGQIIVKLFIDPIQDMKKTISQISLTLLERANVIANPGGPTKEETSDSLRKLASQLNAHLYLIPAYWVTSIIFCLPSKKKLLIASRALIGLSNSVYRVENGVYKANAKRVALVCDSLSIYLAKDQRWPQDHK